TRTHCLTAWLLPKISVNKEQSTGNREQRIANNKIASKNILPEKWILIKKNALILLPALRGFVGCFQLRGSSGGGKR
ncbi:MAG: hypothetical protein WAU28_01350, partial [Candidatus Moraniibacteriota bacterium]